MTNLLQARGTDAPVPDNMDDFYMESGKFPASEKSGFANLNRVKEPRRVPTRRVEVSWAEAL
ncbi:hypothetical protein SCH01S_01_01120 [Sphingomonas changbaiensis NBRC 104936]|uniref:Uncharacterized protein n=1 Tax=Sphingomonas changbaiensis NBRC 104936 TaxID=1219043 RepID=A0A0E9MK93_9SPHN|nr:hypothetical protein SCH01S_01_01120 [Sphingomonas changbaiensis NBRC 104936]